MRYCKVKYWLVFVCLFCVNNVFAQNNRVKYRQFYPDEVEPTPHEPYKRSSYMFITPKNDVEKESLLQSDIIVEVGGKKMLLNSDNSGFETWRVLDFNDMHNELLQPVYVSNDSSTTLAKCLYRIVNDTDSISAYRSSDDTTSVYDTYELQSVYGYYGDSVVAFGIYEMWVFDRKNGRMVVHINAISPMVKTKDGELAALFWVQYSQVRPIFKDYYIMNEKEDVTLDSYFESRLFSSKVIKTRVQY